MAEYVEVVVKIPKYYLTHPQDYSCLAECVRRGTPLPKGHGVLKDADVMINKLCTHEANELFGGITCAEILDFINDEKTIIEAYKVESEE